MELNRYIAYLGYANTAGTLINNQTVGSNLECSDGKKEVSLESYLPGQNNFVLRVECVGDLVWTLGETKLTIKDTELDKLACERTEQKFLYQLDEPICRGGRNNQSKNL